MAIIISKTKEPESIIEYMQSEDSPDFHYERSSGAIFINANESIWLWREKGLQINVSLFYDYDRYNLFLMPIDITKYDIDFTSKTINYGINYISLINTGILPRRIKKGDLIAVGYLVPKVESHIIERARKDKEE